MPLYLLTMRRGNPPPFRRPFEEEPPCVSNLHVWREQQEVVPVCGCAGSRPTAARSRMHQQKQCVICHSSGALNRFATASSALLLVLGIVEGLQCATAKRLVANALAFKPIGFSCGQATCRAHPGPKQAAPWAKASNPALPHGPHLLHHGLGVALPNHLQLSRDG